MKQQEVSMAARLRDHKKADRKGVTIQIGAAEDKEREDQW